jgi:hypothetical protein
MLVIRSRGFRLVADCSCGRSRRRTTKNEADQVRYAVPGAGESFAHPANRPSCTATIRRETILNLPVKPGTVVLLDPNEFEQELALRFRKNFQRGPEIPNDNTVLLGGGLVIS